MVRRWQSIRSNLIYNYKGPNLTIGSTKLEETSCLPSANCTCVELHVYTLSFNFLASDKLIKLWEAPLSKRNETLLVLLSCLTKEIKLDNGFNLLSTSYELSNSPCFSFLKVDQAMRSSHRSWRERLGNVGWMGCCWNDVASWKLRGC